MSFAMVNTMSMVAVIVMIVIVGSVTVGEMQKSIEAGHVCCGSPLPSTPLFIAALILGILSVILPRVPHPWTNQES